jgi:hypothetical protein
VKIRFRSISLLCGLALTMLAAFPVFAQTDSKDEINKQPLRDFGAGLSDRVRKKDIDLTKNFLVEIEGELTPEGKFDLQKTKYVRAEGNTKMVNIVKSAIETISDSGIFTYLKQLDMTKINLILAQDDEQIYMSLKSDLAPENKAKTVSSSLNTYVAIGKQIVAKDADAKTLSEGTSVSLNGKSVIIKTAVPKSVGQEMIQRKLNKEIEREANIKPSGK